MHTAQGTRLPPRGIGSWRLWDAAVNWRYLDPKGAGLNFAPLDKLVSLARSKHIEVLYTFGATPEWASARPKEKGPYGQGSAAEPLNLSDWSDFVRRTARRYRGSIPYYEIWNEPNAGFFTGPTKVFVEMGCAASAILRQTDPTVRIVGPGGQSTDPHWLNDFFDAGGGNCVDVISWHFYTLRGKPEDMLPIIRNVQIIMRKHGYQDKPLWNTESGWRLDLGPSHAPPIEATLPKLDQEHSAAYVARSLILGWAAGLRRSYHYAWDHNDMGFIREDGTLTAAAQAFVTVQTWMEGAVLRSCDRTDGTWQCELEKDGARSTIAWREDGPATQWIAPPGFTTIDTLDAVHDTVAGGRQVTLGILPIRLAN